MRISAYMALIFLLDTAASTTSMMLEESKSAPSDTTYDPQKTSGIAEKIFEQMRKFSDCINQAQEAGRRLRAAMEHDEVAWIAKMDVVNECLGSLKVNLEMLLSVYKKRGSLLNFHQQLLIVGEFLDISMYQLSKLMENELASRNDNVLEIDENLELLKRDFKQMKHDIELLRAEDKNKQAQGKKVDL